MNDFGNMLATSTDGYIDFYMKEKEKRIKKFREENPYIDMHIHTNYSDGELSPNQIIRLARNSKVSTLAITDHDTLNGIKKVTYETKDTEGMTIIKGIELTAKVDKGRMHILGYDFDLNNNELNDKMSVLRDNSINSTLSVMEQIKRDYGIIFKYEDIKELVNSNHNLGRPDLARLCIKYGYANTVSEAFDKYLIEAHNKTRSTSKGIDYKECLELILNSGGIPVLAHPKTLELDDLELLKLIKKMILYGLKGIEVYHSTHTNNEIKKYLSIAKKYNLLVSGGSDFHGTNVKPDIKLGSGKNNNLNIKKLSLVDEIIKKNIS